MPTVTIDERGPFARNVPLAARRFGRRGRAGGCTTPVVTAGGIATFSAAEDILARGDADFVAAARQSLADPDWFEKVLGSASAVRSRACKFTNYCEALDQQHKQVTCQLWDRAFDPADARVARSPDGRRRLVAPEWDDRPRAS
jgi:2,4-dienoyl-CoA reductase-like NADH-dependent reductase (Old Yellow Enzyme family)